MTKVGPPKNKRKSDGPGTARAAKPAAIPSTPAVSTTTTTMTKISKTKAKGKEADSQFDPQLASTGVNTGSSTGRTSKSRRANAVPLPQAQIVSVVVPPVSTTTIVASSVAAAAVPIGPEAVAPNWQPSMSEKHFKQLMAYVKKAVKL